MPEGRSSESREPFDLKEGSAAFETRTTLREFRDSPSRIVREEPLVNGSIDESISHYSELRRMFENMRDVYGVNVPGIEMVVGEKAPGERNVFMVVDKIEGENLNAQDVFGEEQKEDLEKFYSGLLRAGFEAYKNKQPIFYDFALDNIMYGHNLRKPDEGSKFFLTDVGFGGVDYPDLINEGHGRFSKKVNDQYDNNYEENFSMCLKDIKDLEKKFNGGRLDKVRSQMQEIYQYLLAESGLSKWNTKEAESFFKNNS